MSSIKRFKIVIAIFFGLFFSGLGLKIASSYQSIFSSLYHLRHIDSFERGKMWGVDGENFKNFFKEVNYARIQNAANHPLENFILRYILNSNPELIKYYEQSSSNYENTEADLKLLLDKDIDADVELEIK